MIGGLIKKSFGFRVLRFFANGEGQHVGLVSMTDCILLLNVCALDSCFRTCTSKPQRVDVGMTGTGEELQESQ